MLEMLDTMCIAHFTFYVRNVRQYCSHLLTYVRNVRHLLLTFTHTLEMLDNIAHFTRMLEMLDTNCSLYSYVRNVRHLLLTLLIC